MLPQRDLCSLRWPEVQAAATRPGSTVVWPWGAFEQHGPQLPLDTDGLFADRVVDAALASLSPERAIWRLPLQAVGFSPEHRGFPGTLSLPAGMLIDLVCTLGEQLAGWGFRRLVLINGHGGQIALLQVAARQLRSRSPGMAVLPCFLWSAAEGIEALIPEPERSHGLHAGLAETSLMLHLAPERVGADRPCDGLLPVPPPPGWSLEGALPAAWLTDDLSRSGVIGDATDADAALGARLFQALVNGWTRRLEALLVSDWPPIPPTGEADATECR
ncbi:MAG: creatininase family protein [Cyanobium sp.]|nr:creatininase family protein [Cyanobium sp.]